MRRLIIYVIMLLVYTSCSSKSDQEEPSVQSLLTQNWELVELLINGRNQQVTGISIIFNEDKSFTASISVLPTSGIWELTNDNTIINFYNSGINFKIIRIDSENMILEFSTENYKSGIVTYRLEFEKN